MAISFNGQKRIRKTFGRIPEVAPMPNLIEVQRSFVRPLPADGGAARARTDVGLQEVFKSVFPIRDFSERAQLEFVRYELETPKYDVDECQQRGITFAAPLKVTLRLVVWDVDEDTGARSIRDIKEQDVYMGDMPLMTRNGTFIINGTERVIVSQMHRSPGVFFDHDKGKTHSSGKYLFAARDHPVSRLVARFRVRRQGPRLCAHRPAPQIAGDDAALGARRRRDRGEARPSASRRQGAAARRGGRHVEGGDPLRLLRHDRRSARRDGWTTPFDPEQFKAKLTADLIDAETGEVKLADRRATDAARRAPPARGRSRRGLLARGRSDRPLFRART